MGRLRATRAREVGVAGEGARLAHDAPDDGDRHRRASPRCCASTRSSATASRPTRARSCAPARPAASARTPCTSWRGSATRSPRRPADRRPRGYLKQLGAAEVIDRAEIADAPGEAAAVGALGRLRRRRRRRHARARARRDALRRGGGRLRQHRRQRPADVGAAVHPAQRAAARRRLGDGAGRRPRRRSGRRLGELVDADFLAAATTVVGLGDLESAADEILAGQVRGRVLVDVTT